MSRILGNREKSRTKTEVHTMMRAGVVSIGSDFTIDKNPYHAPPMILATNRKAKARLAIGLTTRQSAGIFSLKNVFNPVPFLYLKFIAYNGGTEEQQGGHGL